jgi:hypothetical protein
MKTVFSVTKRLFLISSTVLMSALVLSSCKKDKNDTNNTNMYTISGNASGSQMVPSVTGNGTATMTGTYDPNTRVLTYTTSWNGLSGFNRYLFRHNNLNGGPGFAVNCR